MSGSSLFDKRLIILSGKGGVGKTTISVALGLAASRLKKKTLLVEMNSTERVAPFFGISSLGQNEIPLSPYLTGINLNPEACFEEYVLMQIRFKAIFDAFFNNRFVTSFLNAIPGLNELLMIGKIFDLERQFKSHLKRERLYDLIIVDSPATGHGVSTFEVPRIVTEAVRVGPLRKQSEKIQKLLTNNDRTSFCVVTLAEEMPVVETRELIAMVKNKLKIPLGFLFVNAFSKTDFTKKEIEKISKNELSPQAPLYPYFAYANLAYQRAQLNEHYLKELTSNLEPMEWMTLPYLYDNITSANSLELLVEPLLKI